MQDENLNILFSYAKDKETGEIYTDNRNTSGYDELNIIGLMAKRLRDRAGKNQKAKDSAELLIKKASEGYTFKEGENGTVVMRIEAE